MWLGGAGVVKAEGRRKKRENDCKVGYSLCTANSLNELQLAYAYVVVMITVKQEDEEEGKKQTVARLRTNVLFFPLGREQGRMEGS